MAYASRSGRARTNPKSPSAFAVCDSCGIWHNFIDLQYQFEWFGAALRNTFKLVCRRCLDIPQEQFRAILLPPDPTPIVQARVENFAEAETDYRSVSAPPVFDPITSIPIPSTVLRTTQDCQNRVTQEIGTPNGLEQNAQMPLVDGKIYGTPLPVLSVIASGTPVIQVTCSAPHGLQSTSQISAEGLSAPAANGFYTPSITTATAFTYQTVPPIPSGSLLTSGTRIVTTNAGLPYGAVSVP